MKGLASLESYYVVGAMQKNQVLRDWEQYKKGLILKVSKENGTVEKCAEYTSPPEVCSNKNPSFLFTAGTIDNNELYVGTQTEVIVYSLPDFNLVNYLTLPCFNDIHHVVPNGAGGVFIVNTGLDMVVEATFHGEILNQWNVVDGLLLEKPFQCKLDYRKVSTTKPHKSHPNYVFRIGEDIWVTRCLQKDAICLTTSQQINIERELIHDGVVFGDLVFFSQVDGYIVVADKNKHEVTEVHNLNLMTPGKNPLGWCRGIKVLDQDKVIVGFTRIRPSKRTDSNGKVTWQGGYGISPTRIAGYDLKNRKLLWEINVEKFGMNAIYSIHSSS
ncbi:hypothetical protein [Metabacillus idriensis]|uniref:hypothetical protein n=1 Tax=Metabacillus idriensis TaxID=324768 RepID=UPI0017481AAC|nr:hypothetical protein [Metabacillus idriensis]